MALKLGSNLDLDKVVKSLGQKFKLVPHLDLAIHEGGDFPWEFHYTPKEVDDAWHPSGDCTPSLRDLYRKATDQLEPQTISVSLRKTFMVGHFWHQYLQWLVQRKLGFAPSWAIERRGRRHWGDPVAIYDDQAKIQMYMGRQDIPVSEGLWAAWPTDLNRSKIQPRPFHWTTGSGDIAPCSIPGHGDFAIDFKSMNARMFATGPSPEYMGKWECQGNIYLDLFDMERLIFVGICKDSPHDLKEWEFVRNQELIDAIYLKWQIVSECLDEGVEPPEGEDVELPLKGPIGT